MMENAYGPRPYWQGWDEDTLSLAADWLRSERARKEREDEMSSIAEKLSWEIVAMNDRGDAPEEARLALEITYGVACAIADKGEFLRVMNLIAEQVSNKTMRELLYRYAARGASK